MVIENIGEGKMECKVALVEDLPSGKMMGFTNDNKEFLVVNLKGKYYAICNNCMHKGCKLSSGTLNGNNIECPYHGSIFNVKTGKVVKGPAKKSESTFKIKVDENNSIKWGYKV